MLQKKNMNRFDTFMEILEMISVHPFTPSRAGAVWN